jgi:hypothetical protein
MRLQLVGRTGRITPAQNIKPPQKGGYFGGHGYVLDNSSDLIYNKTKIQ